MESVAFLQCYPEALKTVERKDEVILALIGIVAVLDLHPSRKPAPDELGWVEFPVEPIRLRVAMDEAVPGWQDRALFYLPG